MSDSLKIYLQDHLAGASSALDLLEFMRDQHKNEELGHFAAGLLVEIGEDRDTLRQIAYRAGAGTSPLKELSAWFSEKVSRLKLRHAGGGLGIFEALEFLALGIQGKLALWRALGVISPVDARLQGMDFKQLAARAENQYAKVDKRRLEIAHMVFETAERSGSQYIRGTDSYDAFLDTGRKPKMRGKTTAGVVVLALAVLVAFEMAPDVRRYMKMRSM